MKSAAKLSILGALSTAVILSACGNENTDDANAGEAEASNFPEEDISFIVHTSAGGPADLMTRELAGAIEEVIDYNVVVENQPGGSGATQMNALTSADPDGYTLGTMTPSQIGLINGTLDDQFDIDDFTWMTRSQIDPYVLVVHDDSPYETLEDFVSDAQDNPGQITVGGYGAQGSGHNIAFNIFSESADIDGNWTPFESTGDAVTAVLGQHIDVANSNPGAVGEYVESGDLRILGVMSDERLEAFPDIPTYEEEGYEVDTDWQQFRGIYGPPGMPDDVKEAWSDIFLEAMETDRYQEYMENAFMVEGALSQSDTEDYIMSVHELTQHWYNEIGFED
ncbi:Bug family tripartite tricarboxylate transporter substrate binding protein [Bacillus daqingensis]|uniref:Bug family tripartite tricarboxylate transporter substrate binding protein n=1 Tax=Bacillus daqingensis TaxID=872396 RepID=A0ABV9NX07_9BACI